MNFQVHGLADVQTGLIGEHSQIWQYCVVLPGARIGRDVNICSHCLIENDVVIGDRATIKSGVQLWDGLRIGNDVFVGPNVSFSNDRFPRSKHYPAKFVETVIEDGASIGAGAVILPGVRIGKGSMVGAGAVVNRPVPPHAIVVGNPARIVGYVGAGDAARSLPPGPVESAESKVAGVRLLQLPRFSDLRGSLSVGEFGKHIPFQPRRVFVVFDVPSRETRGEHAHYKCEEVLICVHGSLEVVADDGFNRMTYLLDRPDLGVYLPASVWRTHYRYTGDAVMIALASHHYNADDYIRDYEEFLTHVGSPG
ncbi:MAG: WxcM-like domain-containing protein [Sphingomonadaceae bacterium]|nr:WxcM-like domain-containing protein [Sphingomonadaceae bacterium]